MRLWAVAAALLFVSACAFSSEKPFFRAREGALPIADGARFAWLEEGADADRGERVLTFRRRGRAYAIEGFGDARPMEGVVFIAIPQTREADYVVQTRVGPPDDDEDDSGVAYAFLWRSGDGWRLIINAGALAESPGPADTGGLCALRQYNECAFASRRNLLRFYRERIYPAFVARGARAPRQYVDLKPEIDEARRGLR